MAEHSIEKNSDKKPSTKRMLHFLQAWKSWITVSITLLFVTAIIWQQTQFRDQLLSAHQQLQTTNQQLASRTEELQNLFNRISEQEGQNHSILNKLKKNEKRILYLEEKIGIPDRQIQLDEIFYGFQIAQWLLKYQKNVKTVNELLLILEEKAKKLESLNEILEAISADRQDLLKVPQVDVNSLLKKIDSLLDRLPNLSLHPTQFQINSKNTNSSINQQEEKNNFLTKLWSVINKWVVIKHHDQPINLLFTPEHRVILDQNLYLLFKQLQITIINRSQPLYLRLIEEIKHWLTKYYDSKSSQYQDFINSLENLNKENLDPELPTLPRLSEVLKHFNQKHKLTLNLDKNSQLMSLNSEAQRVS